MSNLRSPFDAMKWESLVGFLIWLLKVRGKIAKLNSANISPPWFRLAGWPLKYIQLCTAPNTST